MIDITKLSKTDIGKWVTYSILPPYRDRGRIKGWNEQFVYVVFRCGGNWDDYADYTAAPTLPEHLEYEDETGIPDHVMIYRPPRKNASWGILAKPFPSQFGQYRHFRQYRD